MGPDDDEREEEDGLIDDDASEPLGSEPPDPPDWECLDCGSTRCPRNSCLHYPSNTDY